jgi:hypothetical protein
VCIVLAENITEGKKESETQRFSIPKTFINERKQVSF